MYNSDLGITSVPGDTDIPDAETLTYEQLRENCIRSFGETFRADLAFDLNMVPKQLRLKLAEDDYFKRRTGVLKARMIAGQLKLLKSIQNDGTTSSDGKDLTKNVLAALSAQNDLVFNSKDGGEDDNRLNIEFVAMSREDFEKDSKVEIHKGKSTNGNLSGGETATEEDKLKEKAKKLVEADSVEENEDRE